MASPDKELRDLAKRLRDIAGYVEDAVTDGLETMDDEAMAESGRNIHIYMNSVDNIAEEIRRKATQFGGLN